MKRERAGVLIAALLAAPLSVTARAEGPLPADGPAGVFVRLRLVEPAGTRFHVKLGGFIHQPDWHIQDVFLPAGAAADGGRRLDAGQFTGWFDLAAHAGPALHGRLHRSGGVAEFPNVTADFVTEPKAERIAVEIELATAPDERQVVKRFAETLRGSLTSFLVSPRLREDADGLETASQMTDRRLAWARAASGGQRASPRSLVVQTSFWAPQRPELNVREGEVLWLLGFNVVGNQFPEVRERFGFHVPGHSHDVPLNLSASREAIDRQMQVEASRHPDGFAAGVPFGFSDEICARPPIGTDPAALAAFRGWLAERRIEPASLGVTRLEDVVPIETPETLRDRERENGPAARRTFYLTSRFRQLAGTERLAWNTEAFHRHFKPGPVTSTLVADHPYFSGTGLGMGMSPNPTWGGYPLALDWFDIARRHAVDMAGIEDWMGLQYMYGPNTTWEGFQLIGFQAAIFRSGSRGTLPIIAWITPSDETNLRLKTGSALCQGAKHFFYWTYGPTATATENYWSDLRGAYDGIAAVTRHLAAAEHVLAPGRMRPTRVALLYSVSSDLWQPFGYVPMLERRAIYLALTHEQYRVDLLSEEDVSAGRLADYDVLHVADPCIARDAAATIVEWVRGGGRLQGSCAAGSRDEFNEPAPGLAAAFGIEPEVDVDLQPGRYHVRGALNALAYTDEATWNGDPSVAEMTPFGMLGARVTFRPAGARPVATRRDGRPAVAIHSFGKGRGLYVGGCPGLAYVKEARFVPDRLAERWPAGLRRFLVAMARDCGASPAAELSHAVVECGVYDAEPGTAIALANFTYQPIEALQVRLTLPRAPRAVRSVTHGPLAFTLEPASASADAGRPHAIRFRVPLGLTDIVLCE